MIRSPWERALGAAVQDLHPQLRAYFGAIPLGSVGTGTGVFRLVGTPRRWIWPVLAVLGLDAVAFPVWAHDVPFTVTNQPTSAGTVRATRVFRLPSGDRVMEDEIGVTAAGLVDRLGRRAFLEAHLVPRVVGGALQLQSSEIVVRLGRLRVPLGLVSPQVQLNETAVSDGQRVELRIEAPLIGLIYQYEGQFTYKLEVNV